MNNAAPAATAERAAPQATPGDRVQQALLALQNSRRALHAELSPPAEPPSRRRHPGAMTRLWWRRLRSWPAARLMSEAVHQWWHRHPWQPLGDTLIGEARGRLYPWMRRHPWATVGAAATLGAAAVAARPWRWEWVDRQLRRAPGAASGWLVSQLTSAPVQAALAGLLALLAQPARRPPSAADETPAAPVPESPTAAAHAPNHPETEASHVLH